MNKHSASKAIDKAECIISDRFENGGGQRHG